MRPPVYHKMRLARFPLTINQYPDYHHVYSYVTISKNLFVPRSNTGHTTSANKEDFIRYEVPRMKSHVALHPGTCPYFMHLPPLFLFHLKPHLRQVRCFLDYILVLFLHFHRFITSQSAGFNRFSVFF